MTPLLEVQVSSSYFNAPFEKREDIALHLLVGRYVDRIKTKQCPLYFFYHPARKLPNLVQWMPLESIAKGEGQTAGLHGAHSMSYDPLMVTKLATH